MHDTQVRIAIAGAGGRMGRHLIKTALLMDDIILGAALECRTSSLLGSDVGELVGIGKKGIVIQSSINSVKESFDILIDFTCPEETLNHLSFCSQNNKAMVIGTTGFDEFVKEKIKRASRDIAIVYAANFSIGVNIILKLLEKVAKVIGSCTDIEIIELHHRDKVDSPSGTALAMGEVIASAMNKDLKKCSRYLHERYTSKRILGTIGFSSIRAGDIVGEHTVIFSGIGERVEITHKTSSRITFANGAIKSAIWLKGKEHGLFDMKDVLNLNNI